MDKKQVLTLGSLSLKDKFAELLCPEYSSFPKEKEIRKKKIWKISLHKKK